MKDMKKPTINFVYLLDTIGNKVKDEFD